jgi:peroxiredoxin
MPDFQLASQEYDPSQLIILGVNQTHQDSINSVEAFVLKHQLDFPILLDEHGLVGRAYQVHSLPSTFFIGTDGVIKEIFIGGPLPLSLLRVEIDKLIKESINVPNN